MKLTAVSNVGANNPIAINAELGLIRTPLACNGDERVNANVGDHGFNC